MLLKIRVKLRFFKGTKVDHFHFWEQNIGLYEVPENKLVLVKSSKTVFCRALLCESEKLPYHLRNF